MIHMRNVDHSHVYFSVLVVPHSPAALAHAGQFLGYPIIVPAADRAHAHQSPVISHYYLQVQNQQLQPQL